MPGFDNRENLDEYLWERGARGMRLIFALLLVALGFLVAPSEGLALQVHTAPEGLYSHQIAHCFFIISMATLAFWLQERRLVEKRGWRHLQISCLLFIVWNINAEMLEYATFDIFVYTEENPDIFYGKITHSGSTHGDAIFTHQGNGNYFVKNDFNISGSESHVILGSETSDNWFVKNRGLRFDRVQDDGTNNRFD